MITQTNVQGPESNSSDIIKDMSPQTNIHAPSFEDDEFEIPSVALPPLAMGEEKRSQPGQPGLVQYQGHGYNEGFYQQQQQWLGDYNNHMSYHYNQQHHHHHQYHNQYQPQHNYHYHSPGQTVYQDTDLYITGLPARSPSGSHSTPSPHSQPDAPETDHHLHHQHHQQQHQQHQQHHHDIKRPHSDFRTENMNIANPAKKPKVSRRKKKRDPHEPQKPVSAYALFFRDRQANIKSHNPNLSFGEVSKMVASMWDQLDAESKAHYKKRTEMAKKDYLRQLAAYRASIVSKGHGEDMYGYMGYGNYSSLESQGQLGQNIPPHPHPHTQPGYLSHQGPHQGPHQAPHQTAAHGTDISTGNQPGIPSLPPATPDAGNTGSPSPGDYCQDNFSNTNIFPSYPGLALPGAPDRNHNTQLPSAGGGELARPGCRTLVGKASDGTENTFCSNEDAYQGYEQHHHQPAVK